MGDLLPWGEWKPDVSSYKGQHSPIITNAVPRADGYGPVQDFTALSTALASPCRGFFTAWDDDGTMGLFAGTATKLYKLSNTDYSWEDVSVGGDYSTLPAGHHWNFAQWGTRVIAVQANCTPQSYLLSASSDFENLGGNPPPAAAVSVIGPFVVLAGLTEDGYTIQWSSRNNPTEWVIGLNEGDSQTFREGGLVRSLAGGEYGLVFQERCIRRMTYSPGSQVIFEFDILSRDLGLWAPHSVVQVRDMIFFLSDIGFQMYHPLMGFKAIGKEKIDRTFFADCDRSQKHMIIGAADPRTTHILWSYKSTTSGTNELFDRMVCYDWQLDRWSGFIYLPGEYLASAANPGITLEALDAVNPDISQHTVPFDSYPQVTATTLALADSAHVVGLMSGPNIEAVLESAEVDGGSRMLVRGERPVTDCTNVYCSVGGRPRVMDTNAYTAERIPDAIGKVDHRFDNRVLRFRHRFPAGSTWTYTIGTEPDVVPTGAR